MGRLDLEMVREIFSLIGFPEIIDFAGLSGNRFGIMFLIPDILRPGS